MNSNRFDPIGRMVTVGISGRPALPQFLTFGTVARMATVLRMAIATFENRQRWTRGLEGSTKAFG
jgi:hypothetical protein